MSRRGGAPDEDILTTRAPGSAIPVNPLRGSGPANQDDPTSRVSNVKDAPWFEWSVGLNAETVYGNGTTHFSILSLLVR